MSAAKKQEGDLMSGSNSLPVLRAKVTEMQKTVDGEYSNLATQWSEFEKAKAELNRIRGKINSEKTGDERLRINVGGERFEIRESCTRGNDYFRALLSKTFTEPDGDGFFFIDRDPEMIPVIMNYLRRGTVRLDQFVEGELDILRDDCEFFLVHDLLADIDAFKSKKKSGAGIIQCAINGTKPPTHAANGIFFEINVSKKDFKLHAISFLAGDNRKIVGEAYYKEGSIDAPGQPRKLGVVEVTAEKGEKITVSFSTISLQEGIHTLGVYSVSGPNPVALRSSADCVKRYPGFTIEKTYHTANSKGVLNQRSGDNEFDLCGGISMSFS